MIHPLIIHPDFFHKIYGEKRIPKNFNNFYQKLIYNDFHKEKFFFIDDHKDTIKNLYKDIIRNILPTHPLKIMLEELIKQIRVEKISYKIDVLDLNSLINKLKIKYYFKNEKDFDNIIKTDKSYRLNEIDSLKFNELIIDLTKYGKKIIFFDPYIVQHMCSLMDYGYDNTGVKNIEEKIIDIGKDNLNDEFKFEVNKIRNDYKVSLKKILNLIYDNNIYGEDVEILIITAIKDKDIDNFIKKLENIKEKYINKENKKEIKEKYINFYNSICKSIYCENSDKKNMINENLEEVLKKCLKNPIRKKQNISIKIKNEYEHEDDGNIRFYSKAINVKGNTINTVIEVGNSINFFQDLSKLGNDKKTTSKLKKQSSFKLELKDTSKEKKSITTPSRFNEFELKKRHIEKLKNNKIVN
tara:strand:- start:165 stop:1400 length:1236 start_codon:yes stop_codon:yes gene_type:complete